MNASKSIPARSLVRPEHAFVNGPMRAACPHVDGPSAMPLMMRGLHSCLTGFHANDIDGKDVCMEEFKGKVCIIVNVASE